MIVGKWSTRALGEVRPYDNDVLVFLSDGTGWIYQLNMRSWMTDTFQWGMKDNGSIFIIGVLHEYMDKVARQSEINRQEISFQIKEATSGVTILTFSHPLGSGQTKFGLETYDVPDFSKPLVEEAHIHEMIKMLHWHTPASIVNEAIEELIKIQDDYVHLLIQPHDKPYWDNAARVLARMDARRLEYHIPVLLLWLQDMNWPGANTIANLLRTFGEPIIAPIQQILQDKDGTWIYWILSEVVKEWPFELVLQIKDELISLANCRLEEGIEEIVQEILQRHRIE